MKYTRVLVTLKDMPEYVDRVFLVDDRISLEEFAIKVLSTFGATFEHCFSFVSKGELYTDDHYAKEFGHKSYENYTLHGMPLSSRRTFILNYDEGEGYEFEVKLYKEKVDYFIGTNMELIDGDGYGIFEDNKTLLYEFMKNGSLGASIIEFVKKYTGQEFTSKRDYEQYIPYGADFDLNDTIEDYFAPLDLEMLNDYMETNYVEVIEEIVA